MSQRGGLNTPAVCGVRCTHSAVGLPVPLDEEAGAIPDHHPLQMRRHGEPGQKRLKKIKRSTRVK